MQRYDRFPWVVWDCGGWGAITCDGVRLCGLRGTNPVDDGLHLARGEDFAGIFVACFLQFVPQHIVAAYQGLTSAPRIILIAPPRIHRVLGETFMGLSPEILEEGIRPAIRAVAAAAGLELIDLVDLFPDARYCFDGVHPQAAGARMMAEAIIDSVKW